MSPCAEPFFAPKAPRPHKDLDFLPPSASFSVAAAEDGDLPYLVAMTARCIRSLKGTFPSVARVHHYSRSILAARNSEQIVGCFAALLLSDAGFAALLDGGLSIAEPSELHLVPPGETAAAIYVWAVSGKRMAVAAAGNIMQWLRQPMYARADLYARPATPQGRKLMSRTGFRSLAPSEAASLWVYRRPT